MHGLRHSFAAACALAAAFAAAAPALATDEWRVPFARGLLFRLDKPGVSPSFVFGTIHSADPRVTALPPPVAAAFRTARTFALETPLAGGEVARFFAAAQFDDGRRLSDFFDPASLAAIRAALPAPAPADDVLMRLKPWAVLLKLSEQTIAEGGSTLDGILLDEAMHRKLAIVGLELPDEQIAAFDAIPIATQVALVQFAVAHRDVLVRDHEAVLAAWLERDLAAAGPSESGAGSPGPGDRPAFRGADPPSDR